MTLRHPILYALALLCPLFLRAGEIRLSVQDASGAPMQAAGKLENQSFQTDPEGNYTFSNLPAGRYRLQVAKAGFSTQKLSIDVSSATPISRIVTLQLAAAATRIDVVETTPLAGVELSSDQIASPVQTATADDIAASGALDLSDFMNRHLNGVYLNEIQGNPFQPDVNFRGYTASPLLGTPQGVSVYLDGVRQNQPFGDVVSWDLIPQNAISEMTMIPGSDPLFGLNTLGGALSVQTKDGVTSPGVGGKLTYGSSGRKAVQAEEGGGKPAGFNWFLAANAFHESGWRYDSPSDLRQAFGRFGWRTDKTDIAFTTSYAYNTLIGNGFQDYRLLALNYSSAYTVHDITANRSPAFNLIARHSFGNALTFSGNAWYRNIRTEGLNPNANTNSFDQDVYAGGENASNTPFPKSRCIAEALAVSDPDDFCNALIIYSKEVQNEYGLSGQLTWRAHTRAGQNQFSAGASLDRGSIDYTQNTQYGYINPNLSATGVQAWQDGSTGTDSRVNLYGLTPNWSLYAADTVTLARTLNLTLSGRYNRFNVDNSDRINPVAGPGSLDGNYIYQRFNPAVGLTWSPISTLNAYAGYTQGSRAPTAIELGCADPNNPCSLPNALASDPPLQQVVTATWEAGLRGKPELSLFHNLSWNAGAFRAENHNDILFVSSVQTGTGYFKNFANTRREGLNADLNGRIGRVNWGLDYTFLLATYQSTETVNGSANSTNDNGNIYIHAGNRIPLIPKQNGKAFAAIQATSKLGFDLDAIAVSSAYARGNENNADVPDGKYYPGPGVSPGYAVVNFLAHYDLTKHLQLAVQMDNLLNRRYYSAAQLAQTGFTSQGTFFASVSEPVQSATFFTPGAPRRAWVELKLKF
jgi:outer membrane receptor protein involved in Fe transport